MKSPATRSVAFDFPVRSKSAAPDILRRISSTLLGGLLASGLGGLEHAMAEPLMHVVTDGPAGGSIIREGTTNVLQFNHQTVEPPPGVLAKIAAGNQKYARARSDYIHPLYGPAGEVLTLDWAVDHPHHRGIYWAWPEVMLGDQTGDLHALQRVFARPVGKVIASNGADAASIEAESDWMWEDTTAIVHEKVQLRAHKAGPNGRRIDVTLTFAALVDGVTLARRGTDKYGGLNTRLAAARGLVLTHHTDADGASPRMAWHVATGTWGNATQAASVAIFEKTTHPGYPADHIEFPELAWLQPAFPRAGLRHALKQGEPLILQYRYLIVGGGAANDTTLRQEWREFNPPQPLTHP
jgi:hypothetical protein